MAEKLEIVNNEKLMHFEISQGTDIAYLEYRFYQNDMYLMHTEVPETMEGQGFGSALAAYAFTYARQHRKPVVIYCPFVLAYLRSHPELYGQLAKRDVGHDDISVQRGDV